MAAHARNDEVVGGILLGIATLLALFMANTGLAPLYDMLLGSRLDLRFDPIGPNGTFEIAKPLVLWINDGLMAIFFFLVGMEIKKELLQGSLSNRRAAALPLFGALGGVIVPALIYVALNQGDELAMRGWAIPMATDIAFAVAIAASLGRAVPPALKAFLLALAIIDDLIAIIVIALFYTAQLSVLSLGVAAAGLALLVVLNRLGVRSMAAYVIVGIVIWASVLKSGVHATLAGVALGFAIPLDRDREGVSLLERAEHGIKPWVTWLILPVFAFANAGVSLAGITISTFLAPVPLGIALGLFFGKQIGVFSFAFTAVKLGLAAKPANSSWATLYGVSLLTGIGFTMSLFIGSLAFEDAQKLAEVRLGVLTGSILSTLAGVAVLIWARRQTEKRRRSVNVDAALNLDAGIAVSAPQGRGASPAE
jgi:NhaA family Na+:H+ antiporter